MAEINPNLLLQVRPTPNIGQTFNNILTNIGNFDQLKQNRANAPLKNQLLQQQAARGKAGIDEEAKNNERRSLVLGAAQIAPMLNKGDFAGARQTLVSRIADLDRQGVDSSKSKIALQELDTNPELFTQRVNQVVGFGRQTGIIGNQGGLTAGQRERQSLLATLNDPNASDDAKQSARIALQVEAPVRNSAQERIATDKNLTNQVAESSAQIEGAKEGAKLGKQLSFKPQITRAVKLAEKEAISRGDTLSALGRSEAAMPGLLDAVDQLKQLAPIATSTLGGKLFDAAVKQTGFGSTKGATARAKFIAIINNQVLPLLKETFGAAFTFQEGESLKATMGDPDATEDEKLAQLDAFIAQKRRDIGTKQNQLGEPQQVPDFSGFKIISVDQ